jgi:hypothetical protein
VTGPLVRSYQPRHGHCDDDYPQKCGRRPPEPSPTVESRSFIPRNNTEGPSLSSNNQASTLPRTTPCVNIAEVGAAASEVVVVAVIKQILCLANSRKHNGRCIAGIELVNGSARWIRPVSDRVGHEVSATERQYRGGVEPQVLDVIAVPLIKHQPTGLQRENWLLDPTLGWRRVRRAGWQALTALEQRPGSLWINGHDTSAGTNDCVPVEQEDAVVDSLKLVRVGSATIEVKAAHRNATDQRPTVRARFRYSGTDYSLKVTDPVYEEKFRSYGLGAYRLGESFLTVSLGEAFKGYFYKLVAAIVERGGPDTGSRR